MKKPHKTEASLGHIIRGNIAGAYSMKPNLTVRLRRKLRSACLGRGWDCCSPAAE